MRVRVENNFAEAVRRLRLGTATGLTKTAKAAQAASIASIRTTFTTRGNWYEPGNRFGVKVEPATPQKLQAAIKTNADWLAIHETGGEKRAQSGGRVAVPSDQARPNRTTVIPRRNRPRNLKKAFVIRTRRGGDILVVRARKRARGSRNPFSGLRVLYYLERSVRIKRQSTFYGPIIRAATENVQKEIEKAGREILES